MQVFKQLQLVNVSEVLLKRKKSARQSKPPTEISTAMNGNDVSDEEVTPVHQKRKFKKSASGNGDVLPVKKPRKSKVMNKKEHNSLNALTFLYSSIFHGVIADHKFKAYLKS